MTIDDLRVNGGLLSGNILHIYCKKGLIFVPNHVDDNTFVIALQMLANCNLLNFPFDYDTVPFFFYNTQCIFKV